jgi:hypothetical protein
MVTKSASSLLLFAFFFFATGCGDPAPNADANANNNASMPDSLTDVAYTDAGTAESAIGIPTPPFSFDTLTELNIEVEMKADYLSGLDVVYKSSDHNFDPYEHKSFIIRGSLITVKDSNKADYNVVLYLIPLADKADELMVLVAIDGLSISFLSASHAQQALFIDTFNNPYYSNKNLTNRSVSDPSTPYSTMNEYWVGKSFNTATLVAPSQYQPMLPNMLDQVCYKPMADNSCQTKTDNTSNVQGQTLNYLQPIAPLGIRNKNWYTFNYADPLFENHRPGAPLSEEQVTKAKAKTIQALRTSDLPDDIGWFGLSANARSQINRLNYIAINFKFKHSNEFAGDNQIYVKSIYRRTLSGGNQDDLFDLKNADVTSNIKLVDKEKAPLVPRNLNFTVDNNKNTLILPK